MVGPFLVVQIKITADASMVGRHSLVRLQVHSLVADNAWR